MNIYDEGDGDKFICYAEPTSPLNASGTNKDTAANKKEIEHATLNKLVARVTDADNYGKTSHVHCSDRQTLIGS